MSILKVEKILTIDVNSFVLCNTNFQVIIDTIKKEQPTKVIFENIEIDTFDMLLNAINLQQGLLDMKYEIKKLE